MMISDNAIKPAPHGFMRKRWRWLLIIPLLIAAIWWWRAPKTMHVLACIPGDSNHEMACWTPLGLCRWSWPERSDSASTLTQYGWDGRPCWSVRGLAGVADHVWREIGFECSSDGHVVAISLIEGARVRVMSWRDGRELGEVTVPQEKGQYTASVTALLQVDNSGRVWLYHTSMPSCPIIAIDGTHIAAGKISIPGMKTDPLDYDWSISPDDGLLAMRKRDDWPVMRYFMLTVKGERVLATRTTVGLFKAANGGPQWDAHSQRDYTKELYRTPDGEYALTLEQGIPRSFRHVAELLSRWSVTDRFVQRQRESAQLVLYSRPGTPRAVFPVKYSGSDHRKWRFTYSGEPYSLPGMIAISPDARHVGFDSATHETRLSYFILGW